MTPKANSLFQIYSFLLFYFTISQAPIICFIFIIFLFGIVFVDYMALKQINFRNGKKITIDVNNKSQIA